MTYVVFLYIFLCFTVFSYFFVRLLLLLFSLTIKPNFSGFFPTWAPFVPTSVCLGKYLKVIQNPPPKKKKKEKKRKRKTRRSGGPRRRWVKSSFSITYQLIFYWSRWASHYNKVHFLNFNIKSFFFN